MSKKTTSTISVWALVKDTFRYYSKAFAASFVFILIAAIILIVSRLLADLSHSLTFKWVLYAVVVLLSTYFWSVAIHSVNQILASNTRSIKKSIEASLRNYARVLSFIVIYLLTYLIMAYWLRLLTYWGAEFPSLFKFQGLINLFLAGLPLLLLLLSFLLALPLIIIENMKLLKAFKLSIIYAWRSRLGPVFLMFILFIFVVYLVMPTTQHSEWLREYNLSAVFDFVVLILLGPLLINYLVLLARKLHSVYGK